ncbi:MAG: class I SAM-dependent methyltransferase [Chloroflexi bacterium]|nr:class I SAM-dependent methyltransferase [Chloroflexota bacterium]
MTAQNQTYDFVVDPKNPHTTYYWQLKLTENAGSVLEIGCSNGFFSRFLVARGAQVVGVESNPDAGRQAQEVCDRVIIGDIEESSVQEQVNEKFDAVILGDVLEHLKDPEKLLVLIRDSWLMPGGRVVASIPNSTHWIFRREVLMGRFPYRSYGLFDRTHLRFFSRQSISQMIRRAGYSQEASISIANFNTLDDITFKSLTFLHRSPFFHRALNWLERILVKISPNLFAYQFVLLITPIETH